MKGRNEMNQKTMYHISYGLYILTAKEGSFHNGCVINTCGQVTTNPNQITIAVNKENKTHDMIQSTGEFNVSLLDTTATFDLFKHFGFQSGKKVDKLRDFQDKEKSSNGIYYITKHTNGYISAKVVNQLDLGTHTLFVGEVTDCQVLSSEPSVTYAYYQQHIKAKPELKKSGYVCTVCGYVYEGDPLPDDFICPVCKHGASDFVKLE